MLYTALLEIPAHDTGDVPTLYIYDMPDKRERGGPARIHTQPAMTSTSREALKAVLDQATNRLNEGYGLRVLDQWRPEKLGNGRYYAIVAGPTIK